MRTGDALIRSQLRGLWQELGLNDGLQLLPIQLLVQSCSGFCIEAELVADAVEHLHACVSSIDAAASACLQIDYCCMRSLSLAEGCVAIGCSCAAAQDAAQVSLARYCSRRCTHVPHNLGLLAAPNHGLIKLHAGKNSGILGFLPWLGMLPRPAHR